MRTSRLQRGRVGENNFDDIFECGGVDKILSSGFGVRFLFFDLDWYGFDYETSSGSRIVRISRRPFFYVKDLISQYLRRF